MKKYMIEGLVVSHEQLRGSEKWFNKTKEDRLKAISVAIDVAKAQYNEVIVDILDAEYRAISKATYTEFVTFVDTQIAEEYGAMEIKD